MGITIRRRARLLFEAAIYSFGFVFEFEEL